MLLALWWYTTVQPPVFAPADLTRQASTYERERSRYRAQVAVIDARDGR